MLHVPCYIQPRLAEKLGDRKNVGGTLTDQIRPIRGMTVEKIAAIKAKRLAKKRATIKADEASKLFATTFFFLIRHNTMKMAHNNSRRMKEPPISRPMRVQSVAELVRADGEGDPMYQATET